MKISIDEKKCLKHKLTVEELLVALMYRQVDNLEAVSENLVNREILTKRDGKYLVTQRWSDEIDEIICDSSGTIEYSEGQLLQLAQNIREIFPNIKMPGTPYYYRCNNKEIFKKLKKFFVQNGNYSEEDILDATRRYVASFRGNYRYMKLAKHFISKLEDEEGEDGMIHKVEHSYLLDFLENKESEEDVVEVNTDDWTANVKN